MIRYFICWKFRTLSQVWDQFIKLGDLADILSVLLMAETLDDQKTYVQNLKIPSEIHLKDVKRHTCHSIIKDVVRVMKWSPIHHVAHSLIVKGKRDLEMLPPTHYTLALHIKILNYQAKICKGG